MATASVRSVGVTNAGACSVLSFECHVLLLQPPQERVATWGAASAFDEVVGRDERDDKSPKH